MISARQLANRFETATRNIEEFVPTVIRFADDGSNTDVKCARWSQTAGAAPDGLAGLIQTYDVAFRVRTALIPEGVKIALDKTRISEDGKFFRVTHVRSAKGDPAQILECKAV